MQTAIFYGASDDLIEVEGVKGGDEFGAFNPIDGDDGLVHGVFNLGGKARVYAIYDGCWHFSLGQVDEDISLPDWTVRIRSKDYSAVLEIDVPDDVKVFREK